MRPIGLRYPRVRMKVRRPYIQSAAVDSRFNVIEVEQCRSEVSELVAQSNYREQSGVIRDHDYLTWRLGRPGNSYRILESRDATG